MLHVHLDERLSDEAIERGLKPNGCTEATTVNDYPVRNRKLMLHVRRRRYQDKTGRNVLLNKYKASEDGTRLTVEYGIFFKEVLDRQPVTASSVARYHGMEGSTVERYYKNFLSGFPEWGVRGHAADWIVIPENIGERVSIDETKLGDEVYTILSNKAGHGGRGTHIAVVRGTRSEAVSSVINKISEADRARVKEITMDFSDSMQKTAEACFPQAKVMIDCFHVIQRLVEGLEEVRLKEKRSAVAEIKRKELAFKQEEERRARQRKYYRKRHPKNPKEKHGRKRIKPKAYRPETLSNGDTPVELLTRARYILPQTGDKWSERQKERARLMFARYQRIKEAYSLICSIRSIFRNSDLTKDAARKRLHQWYGEVSACTLREVKSARNCIRSKEEEVLNYFGNRSTNASAESLNLKIKGFKAQLHGVADIPFFMFRLCKIFG